MHGHDHFQGHATRAFAAVTLINLAYTALEAGFGFATNSLALLSDALHNLGDVLGLGRVGEVDAREGQHILGRTGGRLRGHVDQRQPSAPRRRGLRDSLAEHPEGAGDEDDPAHAPSVRSSGRNSLVM